VNPHRDLPGAGLFPIAAYALIETVDFLTTPQVMERIEAEEAGCLAYRELGLDDESFGL
jgi:hypothetical protein